MCNVLNRRRESIRFGVLSLVGLLLLGCADSPFAVDSAVHANVNTVECDPSVDGFPASDNSALTYDLTLQARVIADGLSAEQLGQTIYCLGDVEQYSWTNVPGRRPGGIRIGDLSDSQYELLWKLIRSLLNEEAFEKVKLLATDIELASGAGTEADYTIAFFVGDGAEWGFQFDGHHVALNFLVSLDGIVLSPAFIGTNPTVLDGREPLAKESSLGRSVYAMLENNQRMAATSENLVRRDVRAGSGGGHLDRGRTFSFKQFDDQGLSISEFTGPQRQEVQRLLRVYLGNLHERFNTPILEHVNSELDSGFFIAGQSGERLYYRIYIPDVLLIEYNDVSRNHIHTVTRLLGDDEVSDYGTYASTHRSASDGMVAAHLALSTQLSHSNFNH